MSIKKISAEICSQLIHLDDYQKVEKRFREKIECLALIQPLSSSSLNNIQLNQTLEEYMKFYAREEINDIRSVIDINFAKIVYHYTNKLLLSHFPKELINIISDYTGVAFVEKESLHFL